MSAIARSSQPRASQPNRAWARTNPLSDETLRAEASAWSELSVFDEMAYELI